MRKLLCTGMVLSTIAGMLPVGASAMNGTAEITPIESNIAKKFWVTPSSDSGNATSKLATDENMNTAWVADDNEAGHWLKLDLGGSYDNVRKTEVVFADNNAVYKYKIEGSADGTNWYVLADRTNNTVVSEGFTDLFNQKGTRYLRITLTGASDGARMGIKEMKAFNYLRDDTILGADMSYADQYSSRNYYLNPKDADKGPGPNVFDLVKDRGMKFVRLRIWNEPRSESTGNLSSPDYISPTRSAAVAKQIKARNLELGIDFHYADSWADPQHQPKPKAWATLPFNELVTAVHDYTYTYTKQLVDQGTTPDVVAIGNEIINGFMWGSEQAEMSPVPTTPAYAASATGKLTYWSQPGGAILWKYWRSSDPVEQQKYNDSWDRLSSLVAAGVKAVREVSPAIKVELHTTVNKDPDPMNMLPKTMEFWNQLLTRIKAKGADVNTLAMSYYSDWHGTIANLEEDLHTYTTTYPQYDVNIAETAYPTSGCPNGLGDSTIPCTVQGQADFMKAVITASNDVINNKSRGVLVWEPQNYRPMFAAVSGMSNYYEPYASIDVYNKTFAKNVLEGNVYVTTNKTKAPALPAKVNMLTMSDGSIVPVPVTWNAVNPNDYLGVGGFTVTGKTAYGNVTAKVSVVEETTTVLRGANKVTAGQNFDLTYGIEHVDQNVYAQDITVKYDPAQVEFVGASSLRDGFVIVDKVATSGQVRLITANLGSDHAAQNDWLKLTFKALANSPGSTTVQLSNVLVADEHGVETSLNGASHSVQIGVIDKAALGALITSAQGTHDAAVEGSKPGQYQAGSKAIFQTAIDKANSVFTNAAATQTDVDQAVSGLNAAIQAFNASVVSRASADTNGDGKISIGDLAIVAAAYGQTSASPDWDLYKIADINGDGKVDIEDLSQVAREILQ
ncbi:glycosyl hydrolase 53 family protein [Paenibacillus planticolens]|nr:glycosyl hydrolase 53 family protein [Paenibacillus planticolens]